LTTKASARWQVVPRLAFSVIEILAGTLIDPNKVARADRFSDEVYGNDLRRVENFSTSQSRHDSLLRMTDTRKYRITPA
jgi:hypothetical protein